MSGTQQQTDPHTLIEHYLHRNARVAEALRVLRITPTEYSHLLASRDSRIR